MQAQGYRADIDGLRAIAVLSVLTYHYAETALPGGFFGVDIFFVISGFLLTGRIVNSISAGTYSFLDFFAKRVRRIFPAFFFVMACCLVFAYFMLSPLAFDKFGQELAASSAFISNFFLKLRVDYFDASASHRPLLHTWSLSVEEQFYLILPILVFVSRRNIRVLAALLAITFAISLTLYVLAFDRDPKAAFFLIQTRFWELALGCLAAFLPPPARDGRRLETVLSSIGLGLIAVALLYPSFGLQRSAWLSMLPTLGAAALLWASGDGSAPVSRVLKTSVPGFVGRISYPLYLWHWPILVFATEIAGHSLSDGQRALLAAASVALATATYWWIETPVRQKRVLPSKGAIYAFAANCIGIAVLSGMAAHWTHGLPWRLSPQMAGIYTQARLPANGQIDGAPCRRSADIPAEACNLGSGAAVGADFVVLGDSHAAPLLGMLDRRAQAANMRGVGLTRFACLMVPDVAGGAPVAEGCRSTIDSFYDYIRTSKVGAIVWIQQWPRYAPPHVQPMSDRYMASMRKALAEFQGKRVLLLLDVPKFEFWVPDAVARGIGFGFPLPAEPSRADWTALTARFRSDVERLQAEFSNLEVRDLADAVCDAEVCHYWNGRDIYYFDDNHLTRAGAQLASPLFDSLFEPVGERAAK